MNENMLIVRGLISKEKYPENLEIGLYTSYSKRKLYGGYKM